ncbi:MAG: cyclic nucleotide-binding domain-containing protein [Chloroflexi bacterium]|nr:cyclic nucleotide-binding domain-containing protein [Chloroflexota bacterium]MCI0798087.1 cyclic nucleotide-binding domain-containing protein [Chloroflexota bacterium]
MADCPNCGILAQEPPVQETGGGSPDAVLAAQDIRQRVSFLGQVEIFQHLSKATLERLASRVRSVSLVDGHIFEENEPTDGLYIITSGMVRVTKPAGTGEVEVDLATLTRGNFFGEIGLIDGLPRSAKVTAMQPTECYFLPRPVFLTALRESPEIALALLPALTRMVRSADVIAQTLLSMFLKEK